MVQFSSNNQKTKCDSEKKNALLPAIFRNWFTSHGWHPYPHQLKILEIARQTSHVLITAPTGGGKTLSGFLPTLIELANTPQGGLHTLYVSPLKSLTTDIRRNLEIPITEMKLPITVSIRTGDTKQSIRQHQRKKPPNILLTTPESLTLLLSYHDAQIIFATLKRVVIDEIHVLAGTKRGDQLALCLSRIQQLAPRSQRIGLSATVAHPIALSAWLAPSGQANLVARVDGLSGEKFKIALLKTKQKIPWYSHSALHTMEEIYQELEKAQTTLIFVNTRAQAEITFQALWKLNKKGLPIALHHGSLAKKLRLRVEEKIASGSLKAVVATSSLDLGVDWAAVDLMIQIGAPKGVSRLIQRIGRAGHSLYTPSRALLVPTNRFEVLECKAALEAAVEGTLDDETPRPGSYDVLAQHMLAMACSRSFEADMMFSEITAASPYVSLPRAVFTDVLAFIDHGGYALRTYEQWRRLENIENQTYKIASQKVARRVRMNIGTIVESQMLQVRLGRQKLLGKIEENFVLGLLPGDTFMFCGHILRFEGIRNMTVSTTLATKSEPKIPSYQGGRLPLSTHLADRVRSILANPQKWPKLPNQVRDWLGIQSQVSVMPKSDGLLVETFKRSGKAFLVAYCFEGRNAHQTLGILLTKRMERSGLGPIGFVGTDYNIAIWSIHPVTNIDELFDEDMLGDDLEEWLADSSLLRRTFREVATISGLIERNYPGASKTGRQMTVSSDLIYDTLRRYEPNHIMLRVTRSDAARGLTDIKRLANMLKRVKGKIIHQKLSRASPLSVPILLEIGKETVGGSHKDMLLDEAETNLISEAFATEENS